MGYKSLGARYKFNDFVGEEVGLDGGDAEAIYAFDFVQGHHQIGKAFFSLAIHDAKVPNIYACQDHLFHFGSSNGSGSFQNLSDAGAPTFSPGEGDGTKGATVIAAVLHLQKGSGAVIDVKGGFEAGGCADLGGQYLGFLFLRKAVQLFE
jgi:hypothetical protein